MTNEELKHIVGATFCEVGASVPSVSLHSFVVRQDQLVHRLKIRKLEYLTEKSNGHNIVPSGLRWVMFVIFLVLAIRQMRSVVLK